MNLDIKRRINAIANPEAIQLFFNLINILITENQISPDDERFTLNVRNDYRKRFSVNINSKLVLYIKDGQEFGFMINQEDWVNFENIPYIKKEVFEKYTPASFLISFSLDIVFENKNLIVKYWLKSCKEYLPAQQKSQYRKHHIQELYQLATNSILLKKYFEKSDETYTSFQQIIYDFKDYIKSENSPLNDFEIQKVYNSYVWIFDAEKVIGKSRFCHYELITRDKYPNKIWIELHFDKSLKKQMKKYLNHLLDNSFFWNSDHGKELSLALKENVDFDDEELFSKLEQGIAKIEERFGKTIRDFYKEKYTDMENKDNKKNFPLNQILYGPPGTGKTYNTINKALEIINDNDVKQLDFNDRKAVKKLFDKKMSDKQIVFATFHQSMSYEDFIEGIKPKSKDGKVEYHVEEGLFKSISKKALAEYLQTDKSNSNDDFDSIYTEYINKLKPFIGLKEGVFKTKTGTEIMLVDVSESSILVKYLWTNNKKESEGIHVFSVTKEKLKKVLLEGIEPKKVKNLKTEIHPIVGHIHCELFAVYKDFYDFILQNKGEIETVHFDFEEADYEDVLEDFLKLDIETINNKKVKSFVLIIDEINRGNISQIFGELITLIENTKRLGKEESLTSDLPYSKKKFGVPANLYIIGTMNTADRSVEALDTALRRRFSFVEMMPNEKVFDTLSFSDADLRKKIMLKINQRIEVLLDRNYVLGHSYFIKEDFKNSFENEIIPLLQEYFYNDYGKIGLVLGKGFVREKEITARNDKSVFAEFDTKNEVDIIKTYELIPFSEVDFNLAIQTLLA